MHPDTTPIYYLLWHRVYTHWPRNCLPFCRSSSTIPIIIMNLLSILSLHKYRFLKKLPLAVYSHSASVGNLLLVHSLISRVKSWRWGNSRLPMEWSRKLHPMKRSLLSTVVIEEDWSSHLIEPMFCPDFCWTSKWKTPWSIPVEIIHRSPFCVLRLWIFKLRMWFLPIFCDFCTFTNTGFCTKTTCNLLSNQRINLD